MIFAEIAVLLLLGGTTWLAQSAPASGARPLNRRLTATGLALCLIVGLALSAAAIVTAL
ncbi:hypothetical protein [Actinoplanes sp. NPDC049681]|uniref:hypothetical protein n=1 Tax=Actinoplanes sp. NPDC049681 TaxID=3363905 RepID=UPI0037A6D9F9